MIPTTEYWTATDFGLVSRVVKSFAPLEGESCSSNINNIGMYEVLFKSAG